MFSVLLCSVRKMGWFWVFPMLFVVGVRFFSAFGSAILGSVGSSCITCAHNSVMNSVGSSYCFLLVLLCGCGFAFIWFGGPLNSFLL